MVMWFDQGMNGATCLYVGMENMGQIHTQTWSCDVIEISLIGQKSWPWEGWVVKRVDHGSGPRHMRCLPSLRGSVDVSPWAALGRHLLWLVMWLDHRKNVLEHGFSHVTVRVCSSGGFLRLLCLGVECSLVNVFLGLLESQVIKLIYENGHFI